MIFKFFTLITLLFPALNWADNNLLSPYTHKYEANFIYEGDSEGTSKSNFVAVLDDGSQWKIDSKNCEQFMNWNIGDEVHIELQTKTEWFIFKKHHLFLHNHQSNESIEISLLQSPLIVSHSGNPQPTSYIDNGFGKTYGDYRQNISISNGEEWEIIDPQLKESFPKGTPVYIGYNVYNSLPSSILCYILEDENKYVSFFIINGSDKNLNWRWMRQGNYWIFWP